MAWNINGLTPNQNEIIPLMAEHKVDILLISEAHCTKNSCIKIPRCFTYITTHPDGTGHAGTAIIVRSNVKHHVLPSYQTNHLQATVIAVEDECGHFNVAAVYCPPRHTIDSIKFSHFFKQLGGRFIAGGDWNSKHLHWGSRLITTRGRQLKTCIDENNLKILTTAEPTYWPADHKKIPDLLDFFVIKGLSRHYFKTESCLDTCSDHTPVILTTSATVIETEMPQSLYNHHTDWESFREFLEENIQLNIRLKTTEDIDIALKNFTNTVQEACWRNTPDIRHKGNSTNLTLLIKLKILEKRRLRRNWHQTRLSSDKALLNKAIVELKTLIQKTTDDTLQLKLESLTATKESNYSLWKFTKAYDRPHEQKPPIKDDDKWAKTGQEKADIFAKHLSQVFKPNDETDDRDVESHVNSILKEDFQLCLPPKPVTPQEVQKTIRCLDNKKAPGYDLITKEVLRELPRKGIIMLTILLNSMLRLQYFPDQWKISEIVMIHKHGKPAQEKTSYRPISLLPTMSKIFEKVLLHRMAPILKERNVLPDHQFGFRKQHGTVEQIHRVCEHIRKTLEQKKYCSSVFLDIQQAFDKVWHKGLLSKIKQHLPHPFFSILNSYLTDRLFYVKESGNTSALHRIEAGVPQGSVLGPILYILYTADLPTEPGVVVATFADDTAILSSHTNPEVASSLLQSGLNKIHTWMKRWKLKACAAKSVQVTYTLRKEDCPPVKLGDTTLPHRSCVKYLGMHLDRRLTWQQHIRAKKDELIYRLKNLHWLLGRNSRLSLDNKLLIYKVVLKPVWMYGIQLWGSASNSSIAILQRQQNKILRTIANVSWFTTNAEIHQQLVIPTVAEEIRSVAGKYKERLAIHPNELARQLTQRDYVLRLKRHNIMALEDRQ